MVVCPYSSQLGAQPVSRLLAALLVTQLARATAAQRVQLTRQVVLFCIITCRALAVLLLLLLLCQACCLSHVGRQLLQFKAQHATTHLQQQQ
jgi:hypothetical protein